MSATAACAWAMLAAAAVADSPGVPAGQSPFWVDAEGELPAVTLSQGELKVIVLLPEAKTFTGDRWMVGYRGARFDWSGRAAIVEYKGHTFIGRWATSSGRRVPAYSLGTSEEFKGNLSIPAVPPAVQARLVLGAGSASRTDPRGAWTVKPLAWAVTHGEGRMEFRQQVDHESGWGWDYTKTLSLDGSAGSLTVAHTLKNTGSRLMNLTHYCHNWITIDAAPIGRDYRLWFPFEPRGSNNCGGGAQFEGRQLNFLGTGHRLGFLMVKLTGLAGPEDNRVTVENTATKAGVTISGDFAPALFNVYAEPQAICPEPFLKLSLAPGRQQSWNIVYTFFVGPAPESLPPARPESQPAPATAPRTPRTQPAARPSRMPIAAAVAAVGLVLLWLAVRAARSRRRPRKPGPSPGRSTHE